jgi:hypothetical protein
MVHALDLVRTPQPPGFDVNSALFTTMGFLLLVIGTYMWQLSFQQDWGIPSIPTAQKVRRLVVFSNLLGTGLFLTFVILVKGV